MSRRARRWDPLTADRAFLAWLLRFLEVQLTEPCSRQQSKSLAAADVRNFVFRARQFDFSLGNEGVNCGVIDGRPGVAVYRCSALGEAALPPS